jgi:hypothetical protein
MSNVLSEAKKQQVIALGRLGWPLRRIEQETGVRRETAGALAPHRRGFCSTDIRTRPQTCGTKHEYFRVDSVSVPSDVLLGTDGCVGIVYTA